MPASDPPNTTIVPGKDLAASGSFWGLVIAILPPLIVQLLKARGIDTNGSIVEIIAAILAILGGGFAVQRTAARDSVITSIFGIPIGKSIWQRRIEAQKSQ